MYDIDSTFRINCSLTNFEDDNVFDWNTLEVDYFKFPAWDIIPQIEKYEIECSGYFKENLKNRLIEFVNSTIKCSPELREKNIKLVWERKSIETDIQLQLLGKPPKIITFAFEYKNYFNNLNDENKNNLENSFITRRQFSRILTSKFNLSDIIDGSRTTVSSLGESSCSSPSIPSINKICKLKAIVGYYGCHYMSFIKQKSKSDGKIWFLFEDSNYK